MEKPINIYKGDFNKNPVSFSEEDSGSRLAKIVIPVMVNGVILNGIVDTRAEYTLMSTTAAKKAKVFYNIDWSTRDRVKGIAGISRIYGYLNQQTLYI